MSAAIPLAGVIGHPVGHSLSPRLHGHWLERYGLPGRYVPLDVAPGDLGEVLRALPRMGFVGANVTLPHKAQALALADAASATATRIGAANTLAFHGGRIEADNTDAAGFLANLRAQAGAWAGPDGPALVFGAGGAARAIIVALVEAGVPELRLTNRGAGKAEALLAELVAGTGTRGVAVPWAEAAEAAAGVALAVNTTALGMEGQAPWAIPLDALPPGSVAADIVYTPLRTGFLAAAEARGATCVDGLGMLLHQAAPGFQRWFGVAPEVDAALRAAVLGEAGTGG